MKYRPLLSLVLLIIILIGCNRKEEKSDAYGNFEAVEILVTAENNGKVIFLDIEEGVNVEKGDVVGLIDTTDLYLNKLKLMNAIESVKTGKSGIQSEIAVLQQQKDNLKKEYARVNKMFIDGAATQKQLDDVTGAMSLIDKQILASSSKYNSIDSEIEANLINIRQIDVAISRCKIIAPVTGTVLAKYVNEGEFAVAGRPVFKVANLEDMYLRVYVSGDQLPHVNLGQSVEVIIDDTKDTNTKLTGVVSWISEEAIFTPKVIQTKKERVNMVYPMKIAVKNCGKIKVGMPGEANFK